MGNDGAYVVGLTPDCQYDDGQTMFGDLGLGRLDQAGISWHLLPDAAGGLDPASLDGLDAVISFASLPFGADVARDHPRLRHIARYGAGFDGIDVAGLAAEGVVVTTTPAAVRRPLALTALTLLLASAHRLMENHVAATGGRWAERGRHRGLGLPGRTVGIVGFGSVGSLVAELVQRLDLGVTVLAYDPGISEERARSLPVELVDLPALAARSDFVVSTAALTPTSRGMFDAAFFAAMRPSATFINVGRGGLQVQEDLTAALLAGQIAGAALDVLEHEPPDAAEPLLAMENVIVTPHALAWTEDFTSGIATSAIEAVVAAAHGEVPSTALRQDLLDARTWRGARAVL